MRVWLDDLRPAPRGWKRTKTVERTIWLLAAGGVTEISLDYDLDSTDGRHKGSEVLDWLMEAADSGSLIRIPVIHIHSANPYGSGLMANRIRQIEGL